jgi:hypothetical protein
VQYRVSWFDNMQLLSAVRTDAAITAVTGMPQDGGQGLMRYAAVGDATGKVRAAHPYRGGGGRLQQVLVQASVMPRQVEELRGERVRWRVPNRRFENASLH